MTQKESIKQNIAQLEKTLKDPKVPAAFKDKLKSGIAKLEDELKALDKADTGIKKADTPAETQQAKERKKKTVSKVAKILERAKLMNKKVIKLTEQQISKKVRRAQKLSTADADIEKDAKIPAKAISKRVSQGLTGNQYGSKDQNKGRTYYEYRDNRTDRQQPPANYPKLEKGGMMASGGSVKSKSSALDKLKGMSKKGKKPVVTRGFSDDEAYEYGSGGKVGHHKIYLEKPNGEKIDVAYFVGLGDAMMCANHMTKNNDSGYVYKVVESKHSKKMADGGMMAKGGRPRVTRGFSDDEAYEYGNGGHMLEKSIRQSTIVKPNLSVFK